MANAKLSLYVFALGIVFWAMSLLTHLYWAKTVALSFPMGFLLALVLAAPFFATLFVIIRAERQLSGDEYQQQLLRARNYWAFVAAITYMLLKGAIDHYDGRADNGPHYVWPLFYWYGTWLLAGLFKPEAT